LFFFTPDGYRSGGKGAPFCSSCSDDLFVGGREGQTEEGTARRAARDLKSRWNLTTRTRGTARKRNGTPGLVARTYLTDIVPTSRGLRARRRCASPRRMRRGFRIFFSWKAALSRSLKKTKKGGGVDREETAARTVVGTRHGQATASAARRTETGRDCALFTAPHMGVDPWADENDEHESRGGQGESSDEGASELEREARRRREQVRADGRSRASPDPAPTADARGSLFPSLASPPLADLRPRDRHPAVLERGVPRGVGGG
jgi:hypothetical protein